MGAKLKAAHQEERLKNGRTFLELLGSLHEITNIPTKEIINGQLDIKFGQFTKGELNILLKEKLKAEKLQASTKYLQKFGRQENLTTYFFDFTTPTIKNTIEKWTNAALPSSLQKMTSESLILTDIVATVYNALLLNRIRPQFEKILMKIRTAFREIHNFTDFDYSSNHRRNTHKKTGGNTFS